MKTKHKLILKSLADLPANTLALAASVPQRALEMTQRTVRATRQHSASFMNDLRAGAKAPLEMTNSWMHGGLND